MNELNLKTRDHQEALSSFQPLTTMNLTILYIHPLSPVCSWNLVINHSSGITNATGTHLNRHLKQKNITLRCHEVILSFKAGLALQEITDIWYVKIQVQIPQWRPPQKFAKIWQKLKVSMRSKIQHEIVWPTGVLWWKMRCMFVLYYIKVPIH